ncbi:MAG: hypothetical protein KJO50_05795, partial [Bacteroidia bacterium]|nr:hypothetical protein [Bacteroidia bacterium]
MKSLYRILMLIVCTLSFFNVTSQQQVSIAEARENDPEGLPVLEAQIVEVNGIVIGPNFRPAGLTFVLHDATDNVGITVFSIDENLGYDVTDGDELTVVGEISQFNGLCEIIPTAITVISQGNPLPAATTVTELNENTESNLIRFENATLVDPMQWDLSGSFNVDITDGVNTIQMRIDSDIDISGMEPPTGTFTVTGTGGQFDNESPFDSGYQIFPRSAQDIDPYNIAEEEFDIISIAEARQIDSEGVLTKDGNKVELNGVVHGINLRPGGLQFALIDATNTGIMVFSLSDQFGYTVTEGDDITIQGELSQFNGLAQIEPEAITLNSSSNDLVDPLQVNILDESTESSLVMVQAQSLEDSQWLGDGSSFNVDIVTANGDTLLMRIDSDTELSSMSSPGSGVFIIGIGGQFDTSE